MAGGWLTVIIASLNNESCRSPPHAARSSSRIPGQCVVAETKESRWLGPKPFLTASAALFYASSRTSTHLHLIHSSMNIKLANCCLLCSHQDFADRGQVVRIKNFANGWVLHLRRVYSTVQWCPWFSLIAFITANRKMLSLKTVVFMK